MKKKIPKFENEDQERDFWASHDSTEYIGWENAKRMKFPNLIAVAKNNVRLDGRRPGDSLTSDNAEPSNLRSEAPRSAGRTGQNFRQLL